MINPNYPLDGILPKKEIGAKDFVLKYPEYDGRGVKIAILDTGIDPGAPGLRVTSEGKAKIIDVYDATGSGDVDTTCTVEAEAASITGLTGRVLKIPSSWTNPSNTYHIGLKAAFQLFPKQLQERMSQEFKKEHFDVCNRARISETYALMQGLEEDKANRDVQMDKLNKEDIQSRIDFLQNADKKFEDCGVVYDVVVFNDGKTWRACIDTSCKGDLSSCKVMASFKEERQFGTFTKEDMMNYALNIYNDGNLLEIVTNAGSHGTHVAGIAAGCYEEGQVEKWGIAPGAQIISIKVGDGRLGSMETGTSLVRAMVKVIQEGVDIINLSYGEAANWPDAGRIMELINQAVDEHRVIFVSSAGNKGPSLSTVTAPGGNCSNIIGVAAYVSPTMMAANYAMQQKLPGVMYTWSSRGPCVDGSLGVCMTAPGAAVAPVPNWTLKGSQLMNGTSMSAPNACGGIALILSALKAQKVDFNPYSVRRAIENNSHLIPELDIFSQGHGLFRVLETYKCLMTHCGVMEGKINFKVGVSGGGVRMKGVYLREAHQITAPSEHTVTVEPVFMYKSVENEEKIKFNIRVALSCNVDWVQTATHLELTNGTKQFTIKINPRALPTGVHFTQVLGYDICCIDKGPIFRVPITLIKPIILDDCSHNTINLNNLSFKPAENKRFFIHVPYGVTRACIKVSNPKHQDTKPKFYLHCVQLRPDEAFKAHEFDKFVNMTDNSESVHHFPVLSNRTIEVTLGRWWSFVGDFNLDLRITFHSLCPDDLKPTMLASSGIFRMNVTSYIRSEEVSPSVSLKHLVTPIRPSEHKFKVLNDIRDQMTNRPCVHAIELLYHFSKAKLGEVTPNFTPLSSLLYENEFESQLWMLYNSNKRLVACGDAYVNQYTIKLDKGDYSLRLQIRHEKRDMLEKLKDHPISLYHRLPTPITLDTYLTHQNAIQATRKTTFFTLKGEDTASVFITPLPDDKLPKQFQAGNYLTGHVSFAKDEAAKKIETFPFKYILPDPIKKPKASLTTSPNTTSPLQATGAQPPTTSASKSATMAVVDTPISDAMVKVDKTDKQTDYQNALYDFKTSWIAKLNDEASTVLFEELVDEKPTDPAPIIAKVNALDAHKDRDRQLMKIVDTAEKALSLINIKNVVIYFSIKSDLHQQLSIKTTMEKSKSQLIECLVKMGCALCDLILQTNKTQQPQQQAQLQSQQQQPQQQQLQSQQPQLQQQLQTQQPQLQTSPESPGKCGDDTSSKTPTPSEALPASDANVKRLDEIFNDLFKLVETSDSKVQTLCLKHALVHGHYGRALKILQKQQEDKPVKEVEEKIIEVCRLLKWDHIVNYMNRWLPLKYPQSYLPF